MMRGFNYNAVRSLKTMVNEMVFEWALQGVDMSIVCYASAIEKHPRAIFHFPPDTGLYIAIVCHYVY